MPLLEARRAVKFARIELSERRQALFMPWSAPNGYAAEAVARCERGGRHVVPQEDCTCGFYGVDRVETLLDMLRPSPAELAGSAVLDVELGGREVEHELGYRAAEQRVLGATIIPWCRVCSSRDVPDDDGVLVAVDASLGVPGRRAVTVLCDDHAASTPGVRSMTPGELASRLGTEVVLADAHTSGWIVALLEHGYIAAPPDRLQLATRPVRALRMGHAGFVPLAALRLDAHGRLWARTDAPAPQSPIVDASLLLRRTVTLELETHAAQLDDFDPVALRPLRHPPLIGQREELISVRGLRRRPRLAALFAA